MERVSLPVNLRQQNAQRDSTPPLRSVFKSPTDVVCGDAM